MKIIHSFITQNNSIVTLFLNSICYILSCLLIKKNNITIELFCDSQFAKNVALAPYDKIAILESNNLPKLFYAYPKFLALKDQPLGTIHIDGDVFFFGDNIKELLTFDEDCIVQGLETRENGFGYQWDESAKFWEGVTYPNWAQKECSGMYNCGVIGFNNQALKNEYFETYWDMVHKAKGKSLKEKCIPDLIIEQQFLLNLCHNKKFTVKEILDPKFPKKSAQEIKYAHLLGHSKIKYFREVLYCIYKCDSEIYNKLKNQWYGIFKWGWPK